MSELLLTCDRQDGFVRAALWAGASLRDLWVDRVDAPDMSGALVCGKIARLSSGGRGWADAGLKEKIYFENGKDAASGDLVPLRVQTTMRGGKGWVGRITNESAFAPGLVEEAPRVWEKALAASGGAFPAIRFSSREEYELFQKSVWTEKGVKAVFEKEPVHPGLDDAIDELLCPRVALPGGGEIVIEQTEALVAIDVNAGERGTPLSVNLAAAKATARQIRLRQLSGLIVVDALKMKIRADQSKVLNAFARVCEEDPAGVRIFGMTKLGLIEMTRTRRGPSLAETMRGDVS